MATYGNVLQNYIVGDSLQELKTYVRNYKINLNALCNGELPLEIAAKAGKFKSLKTLIELGANPNGNGMSSPIIFCISNGLSKAAQYLLDMGANACQPDQKYGRTPLSFAVAAGDVSSIQVLLDYGAEFTIHSCLMEAVNVRDYRILQLLIARSLNKRSAFEIVDCNGDNVFLKAVRLANFEVVKYLIGEKIDLNKKNNKSGETALSLALTNSDFRMFKLLLDSGADPKLAKRAIEEMIEKNPDFAIYMKDKI